MQNSLYQIIAKDFDAIAYRPELRDMCGGVLATILFQQIIFLYPQRKGEHFYKFKQPCKHKLYRPGDSWCEILGFSKREFDSALKLIGSKSNKHTEKDPTALIWYWTDRNRVTYYEPNQELITAKLMEVYGCEKEGDLAKSRNALYGESCKSRNGILVNPVSHFTKIPKRTLDIPITENTTEITTKNKKIKNKKSLEEEVEADEIKKEKKVAPKKVSPTSEVYKSSDNAPRPAEQEQNINKLQIKCEIPFTDTDGQLAAKFLEFLVYLQEDYGLNLKATSQKYKLKSLYNLSEGNEQRAIEIIEHTMANTWKKFVEPEIPQNQTNSHDLDTTTIEYSDKL